MVGYVGLEGSLRIAEEKKEELAGYFSKHFMNQIKKCHEFVINPNIFCEENMDINNICEEDIYQREERKECFNSEKTLMYSLGRSVGYKSLWSALWNLCEAYQVGIEVESSQIPIRQETIEICQFANVNPYQLSSGGSYLIVTLEPETIIEGLEKRGITSKVIGRITKNRKRIIKRGDYIRHLPRMQQDVIK
jgi:hypothetical protein